MGGIHVFGNTELGSKAKVDWLIHARPATTFEATTFEATTFEATTFEATTFEATIFEATIFEATIFEVKRDHRDVNKTLGA